MQIPWHDPIRDQKELPVSQAPLPIRAGVVGRVGLLLLSCGTGAWRVRSSMNEIAEALGLVCAADIGLLSIEYTCSDGENTFAQTLTLTATGVNTAKLDQLERFVKRFPLDGVYMTADDLHTRLDEIAQAGGSYTPLQQGAAAALACGGFTFLLGGGPIEMLLAFLGAGVGQYVRARLTQRHLTLFGCIALSVAAACLVYAGLFRLASLLWPIDPQHQAGYICAMLFIIPGFPFITSGIDMSKQDMRSGLERLAYAIMIVVVATLTAWLMALLLRLQLINVQIDVWPLARLIYGVIFPNFVPDGRFCAAEAARLGAHPAAAGDELLRCVRLLADVQQSREARVRRRRDRRDIEHPAARARQSGRLPAGSGRVFRRADGGPARLRV